ncbi:putative receptor-like protein kinase At4g00960 [Chenopodium quinoa]|uniref:putative receptor-like protein kinase At4g00960 n=1 Tax=Chenopodium quinoa TaxID=63459 RepID=UPI000B76DDEA|nr:putative receptor-like protein kinase At4g00960 [Chenopodium quinoa]
MSDSAKIEEVLPSTMENIIMKASYQDAYHGYATTEANLSHGRKLYCLTQCTPDILGLQCETCLHFAYGDMMDDCCRSQTLAILRPSCMLIYGISPFYPMLPPPQPSSPLPPESSAAADKSNGAIYYIIRAGIPVVGFIVLLLCAITAFYIHKRRKTKQCSENDNATLESLQFDLEYIKVATNNFSQDNWLGRGGFGIVYKGKLPDGKEVAVKRLVTKDLGRGGDEQFKNEILILAKLQHRNLVTLLGFCLEEDEMLLVYEFLPNNSLDYFIFDSSKRHTFLRWETRFKIINGIVRGLIYLHEQSRLRIIHRDLKAGNVLLDEEFNPKISDFGMARLFNIDQTQSVASKIVGTFGYMAPEYVLQGQVSMKSDVYSFGVLVLEIISGQKISSFRSEQNLETLLEFVWRNWIEGTAWNVVDPALSNAHSMEILRCIHVGLLCVQQNPKDRPTMPLADLMLRSDPISLPVPSKPAFFDRGNMLDNAPLQGSTSNQSSNNNFVGNSTNEVSITELHPR